MIVSVFIFRFRDDHKRTIESALIKSSQQKAVPVIVSKIRVISVFCVEFLHCSVMALTRLSDPLPSLFIRQFAIISQATFQIIRIL